MSLEKAVQLLEKFDFKSNTSVKQLERIITLVRREKVIPFDLYAASLSLRSNNVESAIKFIKGPSESEHWNGSGKGAIVDLNRKILKRRKGGVKRKKKKRVKKVRKK